MERATETHDSAAMCNQVLARAVVQRVASVGLPCETAQRRPRAGPGLRRSQEPEGVQRRRRARARTRGLARGLARRPAAAGAEEARRRVV